MEAEDLMRAYRGTSVEASLRSLLDLLKGNPPADLLHFAVHGKYDPDGTENGLALTDGYFLRPPQVQGRKLPGAPFVFLNACQVGSGSLILGDYAGLAAAFLRGGASGVVAPLWSVKDDVARAIALDFYGRCLAGEAPASALRTARRAFTDSPETTSATYLAYQFFGHPRMQLQRAGEA